MSWQDDALIEQELGGMEYDEDGDPKWYYDYDFDEPDYKVLHSNI